MVDVAQLDSLTNRDVLSLAVTLQRGVVEREAMKLVVAADWADRHCPATTDPELIGHSPDGKTIPGSDRARFFGGDGTPEVMEFAPAELGIALEMSRWQANRLIADALDLRHRLPRLWARVLAGEVPAWKACKIAAATRDLSREAADKVDADVYDTVTRESWSRFGDILAGRIIAADPDLAQVLAEKAARARYVRTGATNHHGMKSIHAQGPQAAVLRLMAQINRLAKMMGALGDHDTPDERRSKAIMLLGDPDEVLALITASEGIDLTDVDIDDDNSGLMGGEGDGHYVPNNAKPYTHEDDYTEPPDPDLDPDPDDPHPGPRPHDPYLGPDPDPGPDPEPGPGPGPVPGGGAGRDRRTNDDHRPGNTTDDHDAENDEQTERTDLRDRPSADGDTNATTTADPDSTTGTAPDSTADIAPDSAADTDSADAADSPSSTQRDADTRTPRAGQRENSAHTPSDPSEPSPSDGPDHTNSSTNRSNRSAESRSGHPPDSQRPPSNQDQRESSAHTPSGPTEPSPSDDPDHTDGPTDHSHGPGEERSGHQPGSQRPPLDPDQRENSAHTPSGPTEPSPSDDPDHTDGPTDHSHGPGEERNGHQPDSQRPPSNQDQRENSAHTQETAPAESTQWGHRPGADTLSPTVAQAILKKIAQSGLDPTKIGPQIVLYHHYAHETHTDHNGVVRLEGTGPMTLTQLTNTLTPFGRIIIKPVIDLNATQMPVDGYETPRRLREQLHLRSPGDTYPWSSYTGRRVQMDHTIPYLPPAKGGPPGQTWLGGLAPLATFSHRVKTHGGLRVRQPRPGTLVWRTRNGLVAITDHTGTHNLGTDQFAQAIWHTACTINGETQSRPQPDDLSTRPVGRQELAYVTRIPAQQGLSAEEQRRPCRRLVTARFQVVH